MNEVIGNHEYIDNKHYGINILAKEFGVANVSNFGDFLNKKFDEYLNKSFQFQETCKNNRNSNNFYKYLVLCTRGMINDNHNDFVKQRLEYIIGNYNGKNFYESDYSKIDQIFMNYKYFIDTFNTSINVSMDYSYDNVDKTDFTEFLRSGILNISLNSIGQNKNLYSSITSREFLANNKTELIKLYRKFKKSKNGLQSWDDFFYNGGQNITVEIKGMYDKYEKHNNQRNADKKGTRKNIDKKGTRKNADKKGTRKNIDKKGTRKNIDKKGTKKNTEKEKKIKGVLQGRGFDNNFTEFLTDIFYELNNDRFLEKDFIQKLFIGFNNNTGKRYLNWEIIQDMFNSTPNQENLEKYKINTKKKLISFIPEFYDSYTQKKELPAFRLLYEETYAQRFNGQVQNKKKNLAGTLNLSASNNSRLSTSTFDYNTSKNLGLLTNYNYFDYYKLPYSTTSNNSKGGFQPTSTGSVSETSVNMEGKSGEEIDIQNIVEDIKNRDNRFKLSKETIENNGIYLCDEDIVYVMLYSCSISNNDNISSKQKNFVIKILEAYPSISKIGKEILENTLEGHINFDSQIITLNSNGDNELLEQNENDIENLNQFFSETQKKLMTMVDINDIKNYCSSIVPQINNLEDSFDCNGLISQKINTLIPSLLNINKMKGRDVYDPRGLFMLYLMLTDFKDIGKINNNNIDEAIDAFLGGGNDSGEFSDLKSHRKKNLESYQESIRQGITEYDQNVLEYNNWIAARYERAQEVAENRKLYESEFINFSKTNTDTQNPSGLQIANGIDNIQNKLNHYKIKSDRTEHEDAALRYTAFDTTFNNAFNLNNPTIQKLASLEIDLRSEVSNYGIYNPENNSFNKDARNKFVADKLLNSGLTPEEIESLGQTMESLPTEVEKNYEILCGNFDADQDSFEKIAKIYALGEVIDNIKALFSGLASEKLGKFMGLELDKDNPADIIGDCLFIKGKINGTETNIKYDLRTGKIYMNSFTQENYNPPKIIIGNTEPNTEIGDLGSFEDAISKLDSTFPIQNDEEQENDVENRNNSSLSDGNKSEDEDSMKQNRKDSEELIKRKLNHDLKEIGTIVKEKAGEQGQENSIIDDLLKTFNIFPDSGEAKNIEFIGGSDLFTLIESIRNTNNEGDLLEFSSQMKELMSLCGLSRGKNNENPNKSNFNSVTIFDIDESNATTDIISLQKANEKFFNTNHGEKDKIKSSESHFDSSIQLSFANIIVQKCCRNTGDGRKISANEMKLFVKSVKDGISDKKDVLAIESMFKSEDIG